jgi:riboflavin synthase
MFTGIIEAVGTITEIKSDGTNRHFKISSALTPELKVDQSVAHNGVCLTVVKIDNDGYHVTAVEETRLKTNLNDLTTGSLVNLERCMLNNGRFDGHIVQGHVDQVGEVTRIEDKEGSWLIDFVYDPQIGNVTVEKGSIAVNGVSLTCFNTRENGFSIALIPYTYEFTNFNQLKVGDLVNLEFDIIGKYVKRLLQK